MRAVSMMSMPTSELTAKTAAERSARGRAGPVPGEPALRASTHPPRSRRLLFVPLFLRAARGPRGPARRAENRLSGATRASRAHGVSFDRHGFRQVARLIDVVPPSIGDVIREQLERNHREDR